MSVTPIADVFRFTAELRLLIRASAAAPLSPAAAESAFAAGLDADACLRLASEHGVEALLHQALQPHFALLPPGFVSHLRHAFENNARKNLLLAAELKRVLRLLEHHGITAVPYKGPVLAESAYGNIALRQFDDIDILLRPCDAARAKRVLVGNGYSSTTDLNPVEEEAYVRTQCEFGFLDRQKSILLEIQWNLLPRFFAVDLPIDRLIARAPTAAVLGGSFPIPSPEDMLLVLCIHGAKHLWQRLIWIADVDRLIRTTPAMDWAQVGGEAREIGAERMLWLGLALSAQLLDTPLPDSIRQRLADPEIAALLLRAEEALGAGQAESLLRLSRFFLSCRERFSDRLRYCVRLAFIPTLSDWRAVRLGAPWFWLQWLLRPLRLAARLLRGLLPGGAVAVAPSTAPRTGERWRP